MKQKTNPYQIYKKLKLLLPVDSSLVATLYMLSEKSLLTAIIFTTLISMFLYTELSYPILWWSGVLITLLLVRLYDAYIYRKSPQKYSTQTWYKKFIISAFLTGFMVSSLGFIWIHYLNNFHQLFILTALIGLTAGASVSLSSDFRIAIVYVSIIILPLIISMSMMTLPLSFILPILLTLFYLSQILMIYNSYTQEAKIRELQIQQSLLNDLFSEAPLGMFSYDDTLTILNANKQLHTIFKHENQSIIGKNLNSLPDKKLVNIFKNVLLQGPQAQLDHCITNDGSEFWLKSTGFPFKNNHNKVLGGIGIIEDKTKEHKDKEELLSLHLSLKSQVEQNQFLLQENKQFIADMVHQIRTPLTVIMTNTYLIEMQSESQVSNYITQINSAINMLSNAYEDLSYIISNDTIEYKPIEINLTHFLNERINFFNVIAQANSKNITTNIANNIDIIMNDTELERLIDNNISNAIKHSSDKSEIKIILEKASSEIDLKFISEGKSISNVSMIFDKNYTEAHSAKRSLGLGLSMVKTICEKNSISYHVQSQEGINSFTYTFKT
ncbi:MAG: PAS domain-containing sensor histidine kinase [Campylobacterota bacterium]|nr:PAS domain-containing sensor histidine kinase [Campylobacterota bacterium]